MEREALLKCRDCGGTPYTLYRRQTKPDSAVYENVLWPNSPNVMPPANPERMICPECRTELVRVPA